MFAKIDGVDYKALIHKDGLKIEGKVTKEIENSFKYLYSKLIRK